MQSFSLRRPCNRSTNQKAPLDRICADVASDFFYMMKAIPWSPEETLKFRWLPQPMLPPRAPMQEAKRGNIVNCAGSKKLPVKRKSFIHRLIPVRSRDLTVLDDQTLVAEYKESQNKDLIVELMDRYSPQIMAFGARYVKDRDALRDFGQEVFLKLCEKLLRAEVDQFATWLYVFMRNMFYDQQRRQQVHQRYLQAQPREDSYSVEGKIAHEIVKEHQKTHICTS